MAAGAVLKAAQIGLTALSVAQPVFDVYSARKEGNSWGASFGKGALTYATFELFPGVGWGMLAKDLAQTGMQGVKAMSDNTINKTQYNYKHNFGGNFVDTQAAYTMRQRGIQAIQNNGINARSVLGNEARMYTRGRYE